MNPMMGMGGGNSLLSILINIAFGFVGGLMLFIGFSEVIEYGTKLAEDLLALVGYGQQMGALGFATIAAPYVILAPIAGMAVKQLAAVRSIKDFAFFAAAVGAGLVIAFLSQGYVAGLMA